MTVASRIRGAKSGVIVNEHLLTAEETQRHVDILSRWFEFIHHDDLPDRMTKPRSRPFCLFTFDDGKRSNATVVAPVLERLGVPAVFYVPTRFLSDGTPLWFDRYDALLRQLGSSPAGLERARLKLLPMEALTERLDREFEKHNITVNLDSDDVRPMSWDEARDLARRGFTIGAHGLRHAILTAETEADALHEIEQSIAEVSFELGTPCSSFAFPNGNYTVPLAQHASRCGVTTVMTTEPMWIDNSLPRWRFPRVQLFSGHSRSRIEAKLALAATGQVLQNPDGTGRQYRNMSRLSGKISRGFTIF